nr:MULTISPECIES: hypothetical protein [Burkholderia cepacia complex]
MRRTDVRPCLFRLGRILVTPRVMEVIIVAGTSADDLLRRHQAGDWGEVTSIDGQKNDRALRLGARILSSYNLCDTVKIWIITEADRSVTTIMLPSEY